MCDIIKGYRAMLVRVLDQLDGVLVHVYAILQCRGFSMQSSLLLYTYKCADAVERLLLLL